MARRSYTAADLDREEFQPRFALWLRITAGGTGADYMEWINKNVPAYHAAIGADRILDQDHFTAWLETNAGQPLAFEVRRWMDAGGYQLVGRYSDLGEANNAADLRRKMRSNISVTVEPIFCRPSKG